ncbi:MAG TPA: hypothetical protein VMA73_14440 [Streptosporangiaceae bacterium]|nr:hypothetical protein [Streptosporangiaceae bacterium]
MPRHPARIFPVAASRRRASRRLYRIGTAITAIALASSLISLSPALAAPAGSNISILSAGPDSSGDPYDFTIAADDGNGVQIQSMTAHIYSASNQDVADPTMTYSSGPANDQVWVASAPIAESALPAGTYTVTVDAADGTETDAALAAPGFSFSYTADSLTVTAAPPAVTQGSQSVTFSGTLTGTAPGGTPVGIANVPVNLSGAASNPVATTGSNGSFSYQATGVTQGTYTFSVAATSTYPAATASTPVTAQASATSVTVAASPATVTEGEQKVTFSGSVTVTPPAPATQTPVGIGSGVPIYLNGSSSPVTQTTDANGDFSYTATGVQPGTYTFSVNQSTEGLYSGASATATVGAQAAPTTITVTPSPAVLTFGSQNASFTGTVTALPQGATTPVPVAGAPVYLNGSASSFTTTDANGNFSYAATGITQDTTETFSVVASSIYSAASEDVPVNVDPGMTSVTVTANPPDINLAASTVVFTGTVSVTPFGSTTAAGIGAGVPVYLNGSTSPVADTTDASGDFSYTAHGVKTAADYDFTVDGSTWYTAGSESVPIGQNQVQSTLTVTASPASVTEGAETITFSGTLTGVSPGGSTPVAIQNAPVDVSVNTGKPAQIDTTDVNGDFTYTVKGISQKTAYAFSIGSTTTYTQATDDVTVGVSQARTRLFGLKVTPAHLKYGQTATLKGTVQYLSGTTWTALRGIRVSLAEGKVSLPKVTTGKGGAFTAKLPSTHGPGWTATVSPGDLTLETSVMGNLSIALPLAMKSFSASLATDDKVSATGCVEVKAPTGPAPQTSMEIQYSAREHGPWKRLGTLPLHSQSRKFRSCPGTDESYFTGALKAKLANAYYRAVFPATYSFQATASKVVHAWKYQTRIISYSISPRRESYSTTVTIKGRLQVLGKSWRAFSGQRVYIVYNQKGTSYWTTLTSKKTNSKGSFEFKIAGAPDAYVAITYAVYRGNAKHLACSSAGIAVQQTGKSAAGDNSSPAALPPLNLPELANLTDAPGLPVPLATAFQPAGALPVSDLFPAADQP